MNSYIGENIINNKSSLINDFNLNDTNIKILSDFLHNDKIYFSKWWNDLANIFNVKSYNNEHFEDTPPNKLKIVYEGNFNNNNLENGNITIYINGINFIILEINKLNSFSTNIKLFLNKKFDLENNEQLSYFEKTYKFFTCKKYILFDLIIRNNKNKQSNIFEMMKQDIFILKLYDINNKKIIYDGEIFYNNIENEYKYNGYGKLYSNGEKIYDGFFNNGYIYNDKYGIEYKCFTNKIIYFGQISKFNNIIIKHGKGKEYYYNGQLKYEGDYSNDLKHGKGKKYFDDGQLQYEGNYSNDLKHGKGKEYYKNGQMAYDGDYSNSLGHGKGKFYYENGKLGYDGDYSNCKYHGKGKDYLQNGKLRYDGDYLNDNSHGKGKLYLENGKLHYDGEFSNNEGHGKGKFYYENEKLHYDGNYSNGKFHGEGKSYYENGKIKYDGDHSNHLKHGKGKFYYNNGKLCYDGESSNSIVHGKGKVYHVGGWLQYDGESYNNINHGLGKSYFSNGTLKYEGKFTNGHYT